MKHPEIEHIVVDEANGRTYVIVSDHPLTDGELYSRIRKDILKRGGNPLAKGDTLTLGVTEGTSLVTSP
jgi:hypothetical protein